MKEYIVTGATGFVGHVLVTELVKRGYAPIKILIRSKKSLERFKGLPVTGAIGDILDQDFINKQISQNSVVFHLAGVVNIKSKRNHEVYDININGTKNIVNACIKNKAEKLIYISSTSVISQVKNGSIIKEPKEITYKGLIGHYAKSKAIATNYIFNKCKSENLNAVVVYPSAIIGPEDHCISSLGQVVLDYMNNKLLAYTKGKYNFVDVRDVVAGIISAYQYGKSGEDYILTGESLSIKQMLLILNNILNKEQLPLKLPLWFIKLVLPFAELHYLIRRKIPVFSRTSIRTLNQNSNFSNSKAKEELMFKPRPAKESFKDMIDWFIINKPELIKHKNN